MRRPSSNSLLFKPRRGAALVLALILVALGGLMVTPLLNYVGGGFKNTSQVYSSSTDELYCADAAAREAMLVLMTTPVVLDPLHPERGELPSVGNSVAGNIGDLNGKEGAYTITRLSDSKYNAVAYRIDASGTDPLTSHTANITTEITVLYFQSYLNNALTSPSSIGGSPQDVINGPVQSPTVDSKIIAAIQSPYTVNNSPVLGWPSTPAGVTNPVERAYANQVSAAPALIGSVIDLNLPADRGPLFAGGAGSYMLQGSGHLTGTIFVDGDLRIPDGADINLTDDSVSPPAKNTLFVTGNLVVMPHSTIRGQGAIIALGNIDFQPNIDNPGFFIYLMSVNGVVTFQPNSNYVGAIAGQSSIQLQPHTGISWQTPPDGLNLPGSNFNGIATIENWRVH